MKDRYAAHYRQNPLTPEDVRIDRIADSGALLRTTAEEYKPVYRD